MYRAHVLVCGGTGCTSSGSQKIIDRLKRELDKQGLTKEVSVVQTGCHGLCALGPIMVVYPEAIFYSMVKEEDIAEIPVEGKSYLLIHGDFDTPSKQGYLNLSNMIGFFPDYVLCGHKHFCSYSQETKFIQSGSLAGAGCDYTIERRLKGDPSQMVCICDKSGVIGVYPVILN